MGAARDSGFPSSPSTTPISLVLVDDHVVIRKAVACYLVRDADFYVVGQASTAAEGLHQVVTHRPDVALVDLSLAADDGVELIRELARVAPDTRTVAFTALDHPTLLARVLEAGGSGFVSKSASPVELAQALRGVVKGMTPICASFAGSPVAPPEAPPHHVLSARELEVLELVARGHSSRRIAESLGIGASTVDTYRHRIAEKLGLRGRSMLVRYALEHGIIA